jgi:hypothetical protein
MNRRRCVLSLLAAIFTAFSCSGRAQTSVYAAVDATQYAYSSGNSGTGSYEPGTGKYTADKVGVGFDGGATYLFPSQSRLKAGIDGRGMYSPGVRGGAGGFGAFRVVFLPRRNPWSPYFQIGGGVLSTTVLSGAIGRPRIRVSGGTANFDFGVNVRVNSRIAVRAIEFDGIAGSNVLLSSIGAGVIYTLHGR